MSNVRSKLLATGIIALELAAAAGAQELTAEERAILDQMMRNAGVDPQQANAASAQLQRAQQFGDKVRYRVVGVYRDRTNVSADPNWMAYADVTDRVELQLDWQLSEAKLIGAASLQNAKATLANPRNPEAKCAPPSVQGPFEYDLKSAEQGIGGALRLHVQTSFPPVQVHQFCTGALKAIAAKQTMVTHDLMVPPPSMLAMQLPANGEMTRSADGNSLVHRKGGWTWTFTPRPK